MSRALVSGFLNDFDSLTNRIGPRSAVEVGCGEGALSMRLIRRGVSVSGFDVEAQVVDQANERADSEGFGRPFSVRSVEDLEEGSLDGVDLLICCEVLEHVATPEAALERIALSGAKNILLSVPREPLWRFLNMVRLSYVGRLGNTPGHINHWSAKGFSRFVRSNLRVVETRRPLPWTMVLCDLP